MLRGTLEGVVLAVLSQRPAYGQEITTWLRDQGFDDIAEGTIYALLIRVERKGLVDVTKVPSVKGPPRKVHAERGRPGVSGCLLADLAPVVRATRTAARREPRRNKGMS